MKLGESYFIKQKKHKKPQVDKAIMRKKNGTAGIHLSGFRLYNKATVIKRVWYWHTHTHTQTHTNKHTHNKNIKQ